MSEEIPASLKEACTSGNLPEAKSLYNEFMCTNLSKKASTLSQMAILSAKNSHPPILNFCFSEGLTMNPNSVNDPLVYAACSSGSIPVFEVFLEHGMDVDKYLELGGSPLVSACYHGNVELARFLLDRGADPNCGYPLGDYEALVWAIIGDRASLEIVDLLLEKGTKIKETGSLIAAAEHGNLEALRLLVEHESKSGGCDLEEVEEYGEYSSRKLDDQGTALYKATANGHLQIVEFLLEKGADSKFKDRRGRSVLDIAVENGHEDIARRIRDGAS
ncbi:MAG: hypothetical protein LQ342_006977 [Letrouitia transgressa]|nr:MAG: hypothetical protein LQ342_006977 [Letrouitia transgressa]